MSNVFNGKISSLERRQILVICKQKRNQQPNRQRAAAVNKSDHIFELCDKILSTENDYIFVISSLFLCVIVSLSFYLFFFFLLQLFFLFFSCVSLFLSPATLNRCTLMRIEFCHKCLFLFRYYDKSHKWDLIYKSGS